MKIKIFGREYTLWIAAIAAFVMWLVGFQLDYLSAEQAAWINTVISALAAIVAAWTTRPMPPQVFTYAVTAVAGLLGAYGLDMNQEMIASTQMFVLAFLGLITRGEVSPAEDAHRTGVLGNKVTTDHRV